MFGRKNDAVEDLIEVPRGRPMVVKALDPEKKVAHLSSARVKATHTDAGSDKPREGHKTDEYHDIKRQLFGALARRQFRLHDVREIRSHARRPGFGSP